MQLELLSSKPSRILRETPLEQHFGSYTDGKGKFCALGVLMKSLGWNGDIKNMYEFAEKLTYIPSEYREQIMHMNDKNHNSFSQIASWLEQKNL